MAYQEITGYQRREINALRDRAWKMGLDTTFSQILKYRKEWESQIVRAEREAADKAKAEREVAEVAKTTTPIEPTTLIAALRAAGMTVRQIATAVGVHASTVYRWARGAFRPQAARISALAALAA